MTTPVQAFLVYTKAVLTVLAFFAIFAMTVSRSYIFYEAYVAESLKRVEEAWLRQKCKDPDFYSNMRQHTNLCLQVEKNAQSSIALTALNTMVATTHLCGTRQCADYMQDMVLRGLAWPMAGVLVVVVLMLPSIISSIAKRSMSKALERQAHLAKISGYEDNWRMHEHADAYAPFYPQPMHVQANPRMLALPCMISGSSVMNNVANALEGPGASSSSSDHNMEFGVDADETMSMHATSSKFSQSFGKSLGTNLGTNLGPNLGTNLGRNMVISSNLVGGGFVNDDYSGAGTGLGRGVGGLRSRH